MAKSILQNEKFCFVCRFKYFTWNTKNLEEHHIFMGNPNRKLSEKYGLKVWLCKHHHTGSNEAVHFDRELDLILKKLAQTYYEREIGSREEFMRLFGRNYL